MCNLNANICLMGQSDNPELGMMDLANDIIETINGSPVTDGNGDQLVANELTGLLPNYFAIGLDEQGDNQLYCVKFDLTNIEMGCTNATSGIYKLRAHPIHRPNSK